MADTRWIRVASEADFATRNMIPVEAGPEAVVVARIGPKYFAIEDRCSHDDNPLGEGELDGEQVVCPRHGARFDLASGAARAMPAVAPVRTFPVKVEGGEIFVEIEDGDGDL
jgi:3-phenylpropionate/trans-cinnamate dioxygenase ferredoxin subunit